MKLYLHNVYYQIIPRPCVFLYILHIYIKEFTAVTLNQNPFLTTLLWIPISSSRPPMMGQYDVKKINIIYLYKYLLRIFFKKLK